MAERGRLHTYTAPADPYLDVAGIMKKLDGGPALLFSAGHRPRHAGDRQPAVLPGQRRGRIRHRFPRRARNSSAARWAIPSRRCWSSGRRRRRRSTRRHRPRQDAAGAAPHRRRRRPLHHRRHRHRARSRDRRLQRLVSPPDAGRSQPGRHPARFRPPPAGGLRARAEEGPAPAGGGLHRRRPRAALHRRHHGLADAGERRRARGRGRAVRPAAAGGRRR